MAMRAKGFTKKKNPQILWLERAIREKRGTGSGESYIPWIQIRRFDLNSRGRSCVLFNPFLRRQHHLLSDLELRVLHHLIWAGAKDIREQYPLVVGDFDEEFSTADHSHAGSVEVARDLKLKHPMINRTTPRRMTTDFLVTLNNGKHVAIYVKYEAEIQEGRVGRLGELLEIAREYWKRRNVELLEITEKGVSVDLERWCNWCQDSLRNLAQKQDRGNFINSLLLTDQFDSMLTRIRHSSEKSGYDKISGVRLLKQAIFLRELWVDFRSRADLSQPWKLSKKAVTKLPSDLNQCLEFRGTP